MIVLGCIADDFTGASDAASFLVKGGMNVCLYNGIPDKPLTLNDETKAIVIALKSRTQETAEAVCDSLEAARFLLNQGAQQLYFKYCSTFDSTPEGNIGPVADALVDLLRVPYTILCPALPVNGRTVEKGRLLVNGTPLHESHMKNHPLTPMWDSRIDKLMAPQSRYACFNLENPDNFLHHTEKSEPYYLIPDYRNDQDGSKIASAFGQLPLLTGGSGLLKPLAELWQGKLKSSGTIPASGTGGKALILAGSCSKATLTQISYYQGHKLPSYKLEPQAMLQGQQTFTDILSFIESQTSDAVLVFSSDTPENVRETQKYGTEKVAAMLESTLARLAVSAVNAGYLKIICAGGETSGAITKALGFSAYHIGESIAAGVPVMIPLENPNLRLVLKSGNFGQEDFFIQAINKTSLNTMEE